MMFFGSNYITLPLACKNYETWQQIGATIGTVKAIDIREDGIRRGDYLIIKIEIDLMKEISRGKTVNLLGMRI